MKGKRIQPPPIEAGKSVTKLVDEPSSPTTRGACARRRPARQEDAGRREPGRAHPHRRPHARGLGTSCSSPSSSRVSWTGSSPPGPTSTTTSTTASTRHARLAAFHDDASCAGRGRPDLRHPVRLRGPVQTDAFIYQMIGPRSSSGDGTAEFHNRVGKDLHEREKALGPIDRTMLAAAYDAGVPVYTWSPGDCSLGMNVAALRLQGHEVGFDPKPRCQRDRGDRLRRQEIRRSKALHPGGGAPRTSPSRPSPRMQEILTASRRGGTTISCRSPTPARTPAACRARPPREAVHLGQDRPRPEAPGHGGLLYRFDHRPAHHGRLCPRAAPPAAPAQAVRQAG